MIPFSADTSFFRRYLGDVLALPVYLPLAIYAAFRLSLITANFRLTWRPVVLTALLFTVIFEGLVPLLSSRASADPWDALAYLAGGLFLLAGSRCCN